MKWPIKLPALPKVFGWSDLQFSDRLKLMAFLSQAGAGVAMTVFSSYALWVLARLKATWPVFYLGFAALVLVGIILTGLAGLLIVRALEVRGPGGFVFKSQDASEATSAAASAMAGVAAATAPTADPPKV